MASGQSGTTAIETARVSETYDSYEPTVRGRLLQLRQLILDTAAETDGVGPIEETLKWGQPSYLTPTTGSGSTVRVAPTGSGSEHDYAMFFTCNTNLVEQFKDQFGDAFTYDGNRALLFTVDDELPVDELRHCVAMALTYHLNKS